MSDTLAAGTYEVLRGRLREAANDLRSRFEQLNKARSEVFGNIETRLKSTAHVTTEHNCVPRDILAIGDQLLLGFNVQFGLQTDIRPEDVFALYRWSGDVCQNVPLNALFDDRLRRDFSELYRYYKQTTFSRFYCNGPSQHYVFQTGKSLTDIKTFKCVASSGSLQYVDNRSEHEVRLPNQHAFQWKRTTRDQQRSGAHPHISIDDIVFVECVGGDLTIKIEDNTQSGSGIYSEPVENADQTLDDAEIYYCVLGNLVLLKMKPYQEREFRHLVFSRKRSTVVRLDGIARSCILLPQDHGIIFPGGFVLQTGEHKQFEHGLDQLLYERTIAAPNGEDFLFVFFEPVSGTYLHLRYNVIRQTVDTPLVCHGYAQFDDGQLITIRASGEPQKHHSLQVWQTPFVSPNYKVEVATDSMLYKIGNRDLVSGMAECQELLNLIEKDDSYQGLYVDLVKRATNVLDGYHWIGREETFQLDQPLLKIRDTAAAAVEEFEKVVRVRRETEAASAKSESATNELLKAIERGTFESIEQFVGKLANLREQRGQIIGLRELRYINLDLVSALEQSLIEANQRLGHRCVQFLLSPNSLEPFQVRIQTAAGRIDSIKTAADGRTLQDDLSSIGKDLELLIETISQLKIDDLTQRTAIVDRTGNLLAELNRVRSSVSARVRDLVSGEMEADFASQSKLLDQAAAGALETADTPEKVDEAITRMMLQLEELEGRFAEFDTLIARLTEKRESLYEAFESKRMQLVEARSRRADSLVAAADRILQGISTRALRLNDSDALRGYLASDAMVDKVRQIADQLQQLGDTVRMDDVLSRLKSIGDDSLRQLRDRQELFTGAEGLIKLGKHQFNVHQQPIELTTVVRQGQIQLHLTGTQFFQPMIDPLLDLARDLWEQQLPSESPEVYRGEFLASTFVSELQAGQLELDVEQFLTATDEKRQDWMRSFMQPRHDEGYSRGVHDRDACQIAACILSMEQSLGLLKYEPTIRGLANFAWQYLVPEEARLHIEGWVASFSHIVKILPKTQPSAAYVDQIADLLSQHAKELFAHSTVSLGSMALAIEDELRIAARYLFDRLRWQAQQHLHNKDAVENSGQLASFLVTETVRLLREKLSDQDRQKVKLALSKLTSQPLAAWTLACDAVDGFLNGLSGPANAQRDLQEYREEVAALLMMGEDHSVSAATNVPIVRVIEQMVGDHGLIQHGKLTLHYYQFNRRLNQFRNQILPRFKALRETKHKLLHQAEQQLRSSEFKAKVLTSFIRNRLIDEVYLPLIGDNLAKQIGAAGENKRSDRMGMLLLISPPGYGKTTLMEYIANRLGLVFVKINGPALGHRITSLDPAEANNASAREEIKRINLALEMGDNVMLYLDDIQHCNPELLQKFIPLCDATRRIEGVWEGVPKTYDLRGRKVAVVMAGNPYTESGDRFQIPDMLANRADVYNLGEIIGDAKEAFELSYIENCLTSNAILQPLTRVSNKDQRSIIRAAELGTTEGMALESNIPADQMAEMIRVLSKLLTVRDVILKVNRAYIGSAAQADTYRTEPPFKLQGSYRNMNRIVERVVAVMNDQELETLIIANYQQDAQTLTRDGEANLLKFKELLGILSPVESERWASIKSAYVDSVRMKGVEGEDASAQVLRSLMGLRDGLESIRKTLAQAVAERSPQQQVATAELAVNKLSDGLAHLAAQITQAIQATTSSTKPAEAKLPDQKVLVQHSVPRVMSDLIQTQFQLLYDGLRPLLAASTQSSAQMESLSKSIDNCLAKYELMKQEIGKSRN